MKEDIALTATGTPALVIQGERYPLVFTIAGMKEYAESKGVTFEDVMRDGWQAAELTGEEMTTLLRIALEGGERRRVVFSPNGPPREITADLIEAIMGVIHPTELLILLVTTWNEPPVAKVDPQTPESSPPGE